MILGIETATPRASLALYDRDADEVLWSRDFTTERAHNGVIFEPVSEMLEQYRDQLTGIVVGVGPGSYSGVRVGIAVANGLGLSTRCADDGTIFSRSVGCQRRHLRGHQRRAPQVVCRF